MNLNFLAMFNESSSLSELLTIIPISGILIVFAMLIVLVIIISIFGSIMKSANGAGKKKHKTVTENTSPEPAPTVEASVTVETEDDELIAVISAAVNAMYSGTQKKAVIRCVKPSEQGGRSAWAQAGVRHNVRAF